MRGSNLDSACRKYRFCIFLDLGIRHMGSNAGINQFSAQQIEWRLVIKLYVVKRIGQNLDGPYQSGLNVLYQA